MKFRRNCIKFSARIYGVFCLHLNIRWRVSNQSIFTKCHSVFKPIPLARTLYRLLLPLIFIFAAQSIHPSLLSSSRNVPRNAVIFHFDPFVVRFSLSPRRFCKLHYCFYTRILCARTDRFSVHIETYTPSRVTVHPFRVEKKPDRGKLCIIPIAQWRVYIKFPCPYYNIMCWHRRRYYV